MRFISCSYNNVAKGICLLNKKKSIFVYTGIISCTQELLKDIICLGAWEMKKCIDVRYEL